MDPAKLERGSPALRVAPEPDGCVRYGPRHSHDMLTVSFRPGSPDGEFLIQGEIVDYHTGEAIFPCIGMRFVVAITKEGREYGVSARWVPINA